MHDLMRQRDTAPRPRREWLAWGLRHGTEHPEQTWDRIDRQAADASENVRRSFDARDAGRAEDRFDRRTIGNMARRGQESRNLNAHHAAAGHRVLPSQDFDTNETVRNGNLYQRGPGTSGRARHSDYAWNIRDGW
jgi:hypothetical protein